MVFLIHAHMAPATSRSLVVTGFPLLIIGDDNIAQPFPVLEDPDDRKDGHGVRSLPLSRIWIAS